MLKSKLFWIIQGWALLLALHVISYYEGGKTKMPLSLHDILIGLTVIYACYTILEGLTVYLAKGVKDSAEKQASDDFELTKQEEGYQRFLEVFQDINNIRVFTDHIDTITYERENMLSDYLTSMQKVAFGLKDLLTKLGVDKHDYELFDKRFKEMSERVKLIKEEMQADEDKDRTAILAKLIEQEMELNEIAGEQEFLAEELKFFEKFLSSGNLENAEKRLSELESELILIKGYLSAYASIPMFPQEILRDTINILERRLGELGYRINN